MKTFFSGNARAEAPTLSRNDLLPLLTLLLRDHRIGHRARSAMRRTAVTQPPDQGGHATGRPRRVGGEPARLRTHSGPVKLPWILLRTIPKRDACPVFE
jgi:hypothetical protein